MTKRYRVVEKIKVGEVIAKTNPRLNIGLFIPAGTEFVLEEIEEKCNHDKVIPNPTGGKDLCCDCGEDVWPYCNCNNKPWHIRGKDRWCVWYKTVCEVENCNCGGAYKHVDDVPMKETANYGPISMCRTCGLESYPVVKCKCPERQSDGSWKETVKDECNCITTPCMHTIPEEIATEKVIDSINKRANDSGIEYKIAKDQPHEHKWELGEYNVGGSYWAEFVCHCGVYKEVKFIKQE